MSICSTLCKPTVVFGNETDRSRPRRRHGPMWVWKKQAKKVGEMEVDDAGMKQPEEWMLK